MNIANILARKGSMAVTVRPEQSIREARALLERHNIGALVAVEGDHPVGILSERDIVREAARDEKFFVRVVADLMTPRNVRELKKIAEKPYGLILCVGPTGSGKTTTLHSLLGHINKPDRKIWTAEDPVEITQYGLRQVQVMPKIGFDFAAAMNADVEGV